MGPHRPTGGADLQCVDAGAAATNAPGEYRVDDGVELLAVPRRDVLPKRSAGMDFQKWRQRLESADAGLRCAAGYIREDLFSYAGLRHGLGGFMVRAGPAGLRQSPRRLHPDTRPLKIDRWPS